MGKRGPQPGSGGRPKKALADKIAEGNPGKRELTVLKSLPTLEGAEMPQPKSYLSDTQKNGIAFEAKEIYESLWNWLKERGCAQFVSSELIEHYAISAARLIQCEQCISEFGFLAKHPTTGAAITSPYVSIGQNYMKQTNTLWQMIYQIVRENCTTEYKGASPQDDLMERLLSTRNRSIS